MERQARLTLPDAIIPIVKPFSTMYQSATWMKVQASLKGGSDGSSAVYQGQRIVTRKTHAAVRVQAGKWSITISKGQRYTS